MDQPVPPNQKPVPPLPPPVRAVPSRPRPIKPIAKEAPAPTRKIARKSVARRRHLPARKELSAGGVVLRQEGTEWLVALLKTAHKRGEVWVLPKGHVEPHLGEKVSEAAKREVQEEAGLTDLAVKNQLGVTRFKFQVEDAVVYKTVHYFLMITQQKQLTPQVEEGLIEAAWFPIAEAIKKLEYDTDQDIVNRARARVLGLPAPASMVVRRGSAKTRPARRPRRALRIHT